MLIPQIHMIAARYMAGSKNDVNLMIRLLYFIYIYYVDFGDIE